MIRAPFVSVSSLTGTRRGFPNLDFGSLHINVPPLQAASICFRAKIASYAALRSSNSFFFLAARTRAFSNFLSYSAHFFSLCSLRALWRSRFRRSRVRLCCGSSSNAGGGSKSFEHTSSLSSLFLCSRNFVIQLDLHWVKSLRACTSNSDSWSWTVARSRFNLLTKKSEEEQIFYKF